MSKAGAEEGNSDVSSFPHEQSWSRGENFCVSMTTDGFKGFKGPRDVSGSPRHSLNCATHPNPSLLTQLVPVCILYMQPTDCEENDQHTKSIWFVQIVL